MDGFLRLGFILIVSSLMTKSLHSEASAVAESEGVIGLPIELEGDANPLRCNQKYVALSCPVSCFRPAPVCGVDGITYWCGCADAQCAGVEVAKMGFCEVGNGGNGLLSGQALLLSGDCLFITRVLQKLRVIVHCRESTAKIFLDRSILTGRGLQGEEEKPRDALALHVRR